MKKHIIRILLPLFVAVFPHLLAAQTTSDWINLGRYDLASHDMVNANNAFAQAVAMSPADETANAFYAVTRLLALPYEPAGSNFLTHLGVPVAGRDIYYWTAFPPTDAKGVPLVPAGLNAEEFVSQLRTNVLPAVAGAIANLATITDTNFTLDLTSSETTANAVTVDYGDLKLMQGGPLWRGRFDLHAQLAESQCATRRRA